MPYSHLPPELILHIASFLDADYDADLCWPSYPESLPCLAWLNAWIQTSKFHAKLLTPLLYDRCLRFSPKSETEEAKAKPWEEGSWFTPIIRPCPINDRLHQAAGHWKSDILVIYLLSRVHQGLWPLGESQEICLLTLMVKAGNVAMLETLIELGDLRGRLPELGHLETVTPLYVAILRDDLAAMRVLLDAGADVKHTNVYGQLPLHAAAENGKSIEFVDLLIQAGADIWATSSNWRRECPVESALYAFNKHPDVARRLLGAMLETEDRAADPDWKDQVLHTAVLYNQCGSADIVQTDAKNLGILIQRWDRTLVLSDDCRSGFLACTVLRGGRSNSRSFTRDPELLKIAKSVVDYGAVVHQHCCACVSWKEEFGIECDMV